MLTDPAGRFAGDEAAADADARGAVRPPAAPHLAPPVVPRPRCATRPIEKALQLIETSFAQPVSLAMLAAAAELSVSRFASLFRAQVGISPHRYVCLVRVRHAQRLLRGGLSPSIVATEVGFFDQSHLARHFKRTLGVTPSACVAGR